MELEDTLFPVVEDGTQGANSWDNGYEGNYWDDFTFRNPGGDRYFWWDWGDNHPNYLIDKEKLMPFNNELLEGGIVAAAMHKIKAVLY